MIKKANQSINTSQKILKIIQHKQAGKHTNKQTNKEVKASKQINREIHTCKRVNRPKVKKK